MTKIYLPIKDFSTYKCYVVYDSGVIRAYKNNLQIGDNSYTDFYLNSHYISKDGVQTISSTQELPVCMSTDNLTNDKYYRFDISNILSICSFIIFFLIVGFKVFARLFGRWLKV